MKACRISVTSAEEVEMLAGLVVQKNEFGPVLKE